MTAPLPRLHLCPVIFPTRHFYYFSSWNTSSRQTKYSLQDVSVLAASPLLIFFKSFSFPVYLYGNLSNLFPLHVCLGTICVSGARRERRKYRISQVCSYRWLWAGLLVLGKEPTSRARAASALNNRAISPAFRCLLNLSPNKTWYM